MALHVFATFGINTLQLRASKALLNDYSQYLNLGYCITLLFHS